MGTIYINTRQSEEHRIVIARNGVLAGFEQDIAGWENKKGDIYKAVVTHIEEGLDAAFVNFGEAKNGFLPLKYVAAELPGASGGKNKLAEGDSILVQIKKDHVSDKGAGLTTNISLAGCYLVLMPNTPKDKTLVAKNTGGSDRHKTAAALAGLNVPEGMGVIVRTAGVNRPAEDLRWELESYLLKLWRAVEEAAGAHRGPILIYRENNLMMRAVRDYYRPGEDQIYCDDSDSYHELKNFMALISPEHADCVHYYEGEGAMVPDEMERQIDSIYLREIKTPSGARVVFDSTEAMVTVDVNSAQVRGHADIEETALRVNIEAADVIARHLRLRDLGGLVVVDFIDMTDEKRRKKFEDYFANLLRRDRARVQWTSLSRFGLMELSRQRLSRPVVESQGVMCQNCNGTGRQTRPEAFALRLLRHIRQQLGGETGALVMQAPADAAIYLLNEKRVELRRMEDEGNCEIIIVPSQNMHPPDFNIRKIQSETRVGVSYRARVPEKNYAESAQQRLKKRNKPQVKAVIEKIMPEERRVKFDWTGGLLKKLQALWESAAKKKAAPDKPGKQRPRGGNAQRQNSRRRGGRQHNAPREKAAEKTAAAHSSD
ncbi:MAG: Rne/Rng family ribonuclease, partial [Betaproteobacteria bacterium]|nr:Rne/Rng family ribonuclease [Betaproteobacteria bacterium]